jgi:rubrerythrin
MKEELQSQLYNKYPKIFRQKDFSSMEACMSCDICTGDGWYDLIDCLCFSIQNEINNSNYSIPGELFCEKQKRSVFVEAVQVKEKYGGLRFYIDGGNDMISGMISMAESMSYHICEECGSPGKKTNSGWIRTLCPLCQEKNEKDRKVRFT